MVDVKSEVCYREDANSCVRCGSNVRSN